MSLTWEDPAPAGPPSVFTDEDRALLRANPGRWSLTAALSPASTTHWRRRWGPDGFEFASRRSKGAGFKVYARYVGTEEARS